MNDLNSYNMSNYIPNNEHYLIFPDETQTQTLERTET